MIPEQKQISLLVYFCRVFVVSLSPVAKETGCHGYIDVITLNLYIW